MAFLGHTLNSSEKDVEPFFIASPPLLKFEDPFGHGVGNRHRRWSSDAFFPVVERFRW